LRDEIEEHIALKTAENVRPVAGVVLAVLLLGLLATWIPAQRALSEDPLRLLREECSRILCQKPHTWGLITPS
jgi:hypothetical protein